MLWGLPGNPNILNSTRCAGLYPPEHMRPLTSPPRLTVFPAVCASSVPVFARLSTSVSSLGNRLFSSPAYLWTGSLSLLLNFIYSGLDPLGSLRFVNIFAHFIGCFFTLLILSFDMQKFRIFWRLKLSIYFFYSPCFC